MRGTASKNATIIVLIALITSLTFGSQGTMALENIDTLSLLWSRDDGHNATMWAVRWSPDGSMISSAFFDNTTVVWNSTTGERIVKLGSHSNYTRDPRTRCDGITTCLVPGHLPTRITAWSPDGRFLLAAGDETNIYVFETQNWTPVRVLKGHQGSVLTIEFSPDGRYLASGSGTDKVAMHNIAENLVKIWDFENGTVVANLVGHNDAVLELKWSSAGDRLVTVSDDKTLKMWDVSTWTNMFNMTGHAGGVLSVDWSPDESLLISGSRDYKIRLWNSSDGKPMGTWQAPNCVRSVDWHPQGDIIVTSGVSEVMVMIRNATTGAILKTLDDNRGPTGPVGAIMSSRWSPDGSMLATASGKDFAIRVYKFGLATPTEQGLLPSWLPGVVAFLAILVISCYVTAVAVIRRSKSVERR